MRSTKPALPSTGGICPEPILPTRIVLAGLLLLAGLLVLTWVVLTGTAYAQTASTAITSPTSRVGVASRPSASEAGGHPGCNQSDTAGTTSNPERGW